MNRPVLYALNPRGGPSRLRIDHLFVPTRGAPRAIRLPGVVVASIFVGCRGLSSASPRRVRRDEATKLTFVSPSHLLDASSLVKQYAFYMKRALVSDPTNRPLSRPARECQIRTPTP